MRDVGVEVGFEALEGLPVLAAEEFVLEVSEDLLGGAIVDAVASTHYGSQRRCQWVVAMSSLNASVGVR